MKQAVWLLSDRGLPVAVVAEEVGYSDVGNFRRVFKNYYHISPTEYRETTAGADKSSC